MLPEFLLCLLSATLALAQTRSTLTVNTVASFNTLRLRQSAFALPPNPQLAVSVAICSDSTPIPRFFVSNISSSNTQDNPSSAGGPDVFEIPLENGQGSWTGVFPNGGILAVEQNGANGVIFDVGVSDNAPIHQTLADLPFFGDTTSNQAILFSPTFLPIEVLQPTYPNYTLPPAYMPQPAAPTINPNFTLKLFPTSGGLASKPRSACFLRTESSEGSIANETQWVRDDHGWRTQWLLGGLTPATNYTMFVLQGTNVSGPISFATKSAAFNCPLVHSLPYCPSVAYSVPLPAPPAGALAYDATNMPPTVSTPLLSYLANFTTVLTTFACGRDWYSPLVGCNDCQREYRAWLCSVSFPRCTEPSPANSGGFTSIVAPPSATGVSASTQSGGVGVGAPQQVLSAIVPQQTRDAQRNPFLPPMGTPYNQLLPCLEQCNKVDRACPPFVGFKCPTNNFNAGASYGVGYIDSADGDKGGGLTGAAQDRWGNVWCNMI